LKPLRAEHHPTRPSSVASPAPGPWRLVPRKGL
jgi:hypothetical protein